MPAEAFEHQDGPREVLPGAIFLKAHIDAQATPADFPLVVERQIRLLSIHFFLVFIPSIELLVHVSKDCSSESGLFKACSRTCLRGNHPMIPRHCLKHRCSSRRQGQRLHHELYKIAKVPQALLEFFPAHLFRNLLGCETGEHRFELFVGKLHG